MMQSEYLLKDAEELKHVPEFRLALKCLSVPLNISKSTIWDIRTHKVQVESTLEGMVEETILRIILNSCSPSSAYLLGESSSTVSLVHGTGTKKEILQMDGAWSHLVSCICSRLTMD